VIIRNYPAGHWHACRPRRHARGVRKRAAAERERERLLAVLMILSGEVESTKPRRAFVHQTVGDMGL